MLLRKLSSKTYKYNITWLAIKYKNFWNYKNSLYLIANSATLCLPMAPINSSIAHQSRLPDVSRRSPIACLRHDLARFGNTLIARNPTHRAVTNATFTSGCVHGHRAWFRRLVLRSSSSRRSSVDRHVNLHPLPDNRHLRSAVLYHPRGLFCLSYVHPESQHIRWVEKKTSIIISLSSLPVYLVLPRSPLFPSSLSVSSRPTT